MAEANTIVLIGDLHRYRDERRAAVDADILPGMLVETNSSDLLVPHSDAGGWSSKMFAIEDSYQGRTVDTVYADGDLVQIHRAQPGDKIQAILAGEQVITVDDFLTSNGDGTLKLAATTDIRVAKAAEALDLTGDPDAFIKVYVI